MAPINPERAIAIGGDVFGYYVLPKIIVTQVFKRMAKGDIEKAITAKCGADNVTTEERTRLQTELAQQLKAPGVTMWRPKLPGLGWKIPTPFVDFNVMRGWTGSWVGGADAIFGLTWALGYDRIASALGEDKRQLTPALNFYGIAWPLAGLYAMSPWVPGVKNMKWVQKGAYNTALSTVTAPDNIHCKNEPPSGGEPAPATSPATADDALALSDEDLSSAEMVALDPSWAPVIQAYLPQVLAENPLLAATLHANSYWGTNSSFFGPTLIPDGLGGYVDPVRMMSFPDPVSADATMMESASLVSIPMSSSGDWTSRIAQAAGAQSTASHATLQENKVSLSSIDMGQVSLKGLKTFSGAPGVVTMPMPVTLKMPVVSFRMSPNMTGAMAGAVK